MTAIKVENIGKRYVIDHQKQQSRYRYETLGGTLASCGKRAYSYLRHPLSSFNNTVEHEDFWALKDINFEINKGDRVGIIGRNGAGKSTLLKILSRITAPTTGKITIKGRVSSLLEVGTGFHPELTGRENIFLNGAILGMKRQEIKSKFDEIVAFAEVEKFLDTPVKHYSSGMYVRLAFAVAAHLEPEILILDEVLAVGDAQFQKKCLGKMKEVGVEGTTLLFVSHNMSAINELCNRACLISQGSLSHDGSVSEILQKYLALGSSSAEINLEHFKHKGPQEFVRITKLSLMDNNGNLTTSFQMNDPFVAKIELTCFRRMLNTEVGLKISSYHGAAIHYLTSTWEGLYVDIEPGSHTFVVKVPHLCLYPGTYVIGLWVLSEPAWSDDSVQEITQINVLKGDVTGYRTRFDQYVVSGCEVYTPSEWVVHSAEIVS
jgi:lipopolysaccharide transport system ATP-binding protein